MTYLSLISLQSWAFENGDRITGLRSKRYKRTPKHNFVVFPTSLSFFQWKWPSQQHSGYFAKWVRESMGHSIILKASVRTQWVSETASGFSETVTLPQQFHSGYSLIYVQSTEASELYVKWFLFFSPTKEKQPGHNELKHECSENICFLTNESEMHYLLIQTLEGLESMQNVSLSKSIWLGEL